MSLINKPKNSEEIDRMTLEREDLLKNILPDGTVAPLYESQDCLFCAGIDVGEREYFAIADLGHEEPKGTKVSAIGLKVNTEIGTILPIEISCCSRCKKNHQRANALPAIIIAATMILGLVFLGLSPYNKWITGVSSALPLLFFIILLPIGYLVGQMAKISFINKKSSRTIFDIFEIPFINRMKLAGWFSIFGKNKDATLIFSKTRLKNNNIK